MQETEFGVLKTTFEAHLRELRNYLLAILHAVPEATPPKLYAQFLPGM